MPESGTYLFTSVGFSSNEEPFLLFQQNESFLPFNPIKESFTLTFDMERRYCIGWKDITAGQQFTCPSRQAVESKFEQCAACQKRTGFNPAFYHATSVSAQQEARNAEPHILYLAHFGQGIIKIGISHAKRGNARLLEQGARSALILDTFPSAHIARQYEAKIAKMPNVAETIQLRKKVDAMTRPYDNEAAKQELGSMKAAIQSHVGCELATQPIVSFGSLYFPAGIPDISMAHPTSSQDMISGDVIGLLGSILFCRQGEDYFYMSLKKYAGYLVTITDTVAPITTPARQTSLF